MIQLAKQRPSWRVLAETAHNLRQSAMIPIEVGEHLDHRNATQTPSARVNGPTAAKPQSNLIGLSEKLDWTTTVGCAQSPIELGDEFALGCAKHQL